jgi:hypothetical protein
MNKYIDPKIVNWLLEKGDPEIRYHALQEFAGKISLHLTSELEQIEELAEPKLLIESAQNQIIGDPKYFDIFYRGTVWGFAWLVEQGLNIKNQTIQKTADYITGHWQLESGGFTMNWQPAAESTAFSAAILKSLLKAEYESSAVHHVAEWLIATQNDDGGWKNSSINGLMDSLRFVLLGKSCVGDKNREKSCTRSCPYATLSVLEALLCYRDKYKKNQDSIDKAVAYVFSEKLLEKKSLSSRDNFYQNRNIYKIGYPVVLQFDILKILLLIARAGYFNERKINEAFNYIIKIRNSEGRWDFQSYETGMIYNKRNQKYKVKANKWATLNALRLMKYADK